MFKKYHSIENSYREELLNKIKSYDFWDEEYVVQEKAHGANLSYWTTDGDSFHAGKRTAALTTNERFYNFGSVLESIQPKLKGIWTSLKEAFPVMTQMTVFGELIGGNYPHESVPRSKTAIKVQKGIYYSPENCFYAFDIMIDCQTYLNIDQANELFEKHGLLHAKTIFRGKLESCLSYPNIFESIIPELLGLPKLKPNICEGTIIKPVNNLWFRNGTRVVLKNKNDKWSEKIKVQKRERIIEEVPEQVAELQKVISTYVTENRLNNVISKEGELSKSDFGRLLGLFNKDVFEDFLKENQLAFDVLEKKEKKMITKSINQKAVKLVKKVLT